MIVVKRGDFPRKVQPPTSAIRSLLPGMLVVSTSTLRRFHNSQKETLDIGQCLVPVRSGPDPLAQHILTPIVAKELNLKLDGVVFFGWQHDGNYIVTVGCAGEVKHTSIHSGGAGDLALLTTIDVGFRWRKPARSARLDLNKAKRLAFVSDQVNLYIND